MDTEHKGSATDSSTTEPQLKKTRLSESESAHEVSRPVLTSAVRGNMQLSIPDSQRSNTMQSLNEALYEQIGIKLQQNMNSSLYGLCARYCTEFIKVNQPAEEEVDENRARPDPLEQFSTKITEFSKYKMEKFGSWLTSTVKNHKNWHDKFVTEKQNQLATVLSSAKNNTSSMFSAIIENAMEEEEEEGTNAPDEST